MFVVKFFHADLADIFIEITKQEYPLNLREKDFQQKQKSLRTLRLENKRTIFF